MDYLSSGNIERSLDVTEQLMLGYYEEYGLSWDRAKRKELLASSMHYHVLENDIFLGFFAYFTNEDHIYLCDLQLLPEHQNKGIGGSVVRFIVRQASSLNLKAVKLSVFRSNSTAIKFYQKQGFTVFEESNMVYRFNLSIT